MRCIEGGFQCSICFLDANPNDWRKCWSKLIFRIIVQQHFWRKFSFHGVPERWGSNARVPSVTGGWGGGGKGFDIFRNCTMRYWRQCSGLHYSVSPQPPRDFRATFLDPRSSLSWRLESATRGTNVYLHMIVQISNWIKTFQRKDEPDFSV